MITYRTSEEMDVEARIESVAMIQDAIQGREPQQIIVGTESSQSNGSNVATQSASSSGKSAGHSNFLKYTSLMVLMVQNAAQTLVMRYVRTRSGPMFMSTTAVVMSEFIKMVTCLMIIFAEEKYSIGAWMRHLKVNIIDDPKDFAKVSIPAIVYMLQNNLLYVAASNLEAATYQVTYQLKILTTALFSVSMLQKQLTKLQWLSLVILFIGIAAVQLQPPGQSKNISTAVADHQNALVGLLAVAAACLMSGFAGVYFEKLLKNTPQSVFVRNVQLGFIGCMFGCLTAAINDGEKIQAYGFFYGYSFWVWCVIFLMSVGGLVVAVVVKYADNILKGFATSGSIIIACIASVYLFNFQLSLSFTIGTILVLVAVYMYSKFVPQQSPPIHKPVDVENQVAHRSSDKVSSERLL